MPTKDQIFEEICKLVKEGAAGTPLAPEVRGILYARYYDWIDRVKPGMDRSPMDVWTGKDGKGLKGRFRAIGRSAAKRCKKAKKTRVDMHMSTGAYKEVEASAQSDCPFCPPPPSG
jgi:hypothetical protein